MKTVLDDQCAGWDDLGRFSWHFVFSGDYYYIRDAHFLIADMYTWQLINDYFEVI